MKNFKKEKGITLVALIITIIVLLILAVVTISAVNEGSLFSYANNAAEGYSKAQEEENTMISNWLTELAKHDNKNVTSTLKFTDVAGTYYQYSAGEKVSTAYFILNSDGTGKHANAGESIAEQSGEYTIQGNTVIMTAPEFVIGTQHLHHFYVYFRFEVVNGKRQLVQYFQKCDELPNGEEITWTWKED